ncbi:hypothetical protein KC19_5G017600 [Ceratodon purpureus]|uniref:Uncharacterized protein n=1 Tax=Ceratodon purpureus TaxID=3225 RepID=A0A8T0HWX8_CERPU|nr:hypothetical protein KC19_5G017600 [Ceratodon purpureus]
MMTKVELSELPDMRETASTQEEIVVKESPLHPRALSMNGKENPEQPRLSKLLKAANSSLEKKLHHKDEKLHELKYRCAHLLKVEKRCNDLQNELKVKKEHVDVLRKGQVCMQQQADDNERKHTEDLTLLVSALEESKADLGAQAQLIEILVRDLQKMKSTLEYCKDELTGRRVVEIRESHAGVEQLAQEQTNSQMMKYDMEYQMSLLHDSLLESSARLEHVTSQLRESCHQKESVQKNLERSMVSLQEASVDVVLENAAKSLEFKSMKLLQRLMATRLRWGHTVAANCQLFIEN